MDQKKIKGFKNGFNSELETSVSQMDENLMTQKTVSIASENMKKLNTVNWPYSIQHAGSSFNEPLNCLDCLRIYIKKRKLDLGESND